MFCCCFKDSANTTLVSSDYSAIMLFVLVAFCFRRDGEDAHSWYSQSDATVNKVSFTLLGFHLGKRSSIVKDALLLAAAKRKKKKSRGGLDAYSN